MMKAENSIVTQSQHSTKAIGIVGLGLIGGSLALDLQNLGWHVNALVHRSSTEQRAKERRLAQTISTDPQILSDCSIVILALPINQLLTPSEKLVKSLPQAAVITDVGSVKSSIIKTWGKLHPRFIGSHPMAGTTDSGVDAGTKNLFKDCSWISTPIKGTDKEALEVIKQLAISLGSNWITSDPEIHDQAVALISHLPVLISASLLATLENINNPGVIKLAKVLASSGFADTTRIGGGNPQLGKDMTANNTESILKALTTYRWTLEQFEEIVLASNWVQLEEELKKTKTIRKSLNI